MHCTPHVVEDPEDPSRIRECSLIDADRRCHGFCRTGGWGGHKSARMPPWRESGSGRRPPYSAVFGAGTTC